jgi:hypothetical protein
VFNAGGALYTQADTAPALATNGTLWFDSTGGQLYVRYNDPSTSAKNWVIANSPPPAVAATVTLEVSLANNFTATQGVWNTHKYDTKVTDTQNAYNPATGLFTPTVAGVYAVSATIAYNQQLSGTAWGIAIVKNGLLTNPETQTLRGATGAGAAILQPLSISAQIFCNGTTDTISVQGFLPTSTTVFQSSANAGVAVNMVATLLMVGAPGPQGPVAQVSGDRVLIGTTVVSSAVASVDFLATSAFNGTYDELELRTYDWQASAENSPWLRFSADGSTFSAGASDYLYTWMQVNASNATSNAGAAGSAILMGTLVAAGATSASYSVVRIRLGGGAGGARACAMYEQVQGNSVNSYRITGAGFWSLAPVGQPVLGLRVMLGASANIIRGTFKLYGIVK